VIEVDLGLALGVDEALRKVSGHVVGFRPLVHLRLELFLLWSFRVLWCLFNWIAVLINLFDFLLLWCLGELFKFNVLGIEGFWLIYELKTYD
jgi:hypothetical protein